MQLSSYKRNTFSSIVFILGIISIGKLLQNKSFKRGQLEHLTLRLLQKCIFSLGRELSPINILMTLLAILSLSCMIKTIKQMKLFQYVCKLLDDSNFDDGRG